MAFRPLITSIPGDIDLHPLVFFIPLVMVQEPEGNRIESNPRPVLAESSSACELRIFSGDRRIRFDGNQDLFFGHFDLFQI